VSGNLHALAWAKDITVAPDGSPLTSTEKLVLYVLADYYNPAYSCAWPRQEVLARVCCLSRSSVVRALGSLGRKGLVTQEHRFDKDGRQINSRYRLALHWTPVTVDEPVEDIPADEPAPAAAAKVTVTALRDGLLELAPAIAADYADVGAHAGYRAVLDAAVTLAGDHPAVSKDPTKYLSDAVVVWAIEDLHSIPAAKTASRISKATATLGSDAHRALLAALTDTAAADVKGDIISYVVRTAENRIRERAVAR
jgi:hypothetical protein